jgi:hypothetical protein
VSGGYVCWGLLTGWAAFGGAREALTGTRLVLGCCGGFWVQLEVAATAVGLWAQGGSGSLVQIRGVYVFLCSIQPAHCRDTWRPRIARMRMVRHLCFVFCSESANACAWCNVATRARQVF